MGTIFEQVSFFSNEGFLSFVVVGGFVVLGTKQDEKLNGENVNIGVVKIVNSMFGHDRKYQRKPTFDTCTF